MLLDCRESKLHKLDNLSRNEVIATDSGWTLTRVSRNIARLDGDFSNVNFEEITSHLTPSGMYYHYLDSTSNVAFIPPESIRSKIRYPEKQLLFGSLYSSNSHGMILSSCGNYIVSTTNKGSWAVRYSQLVEVW